MNETHSISGHQATYSYGRDEYGEYGSLVEPESELQVAEALELTPAQPFAEANSN